MHELYIAESILALTLKSLPSGVESDSVRQVEVEVGQLDAVVGENLIFIFDAIKSSFGLQRTELTLKTVEVRCKCLDCAHQFGIEMPFFICPQCGRGRVEVLQGRGIRLIKIMTED